MIALDKSGSRLTVFIKCGELHVENIGCWYNGYFLNSDVLNIIYMYVIQDVKIIYSTSEEKNGWPVVQRR